MLASPFHYIPNANPLFTFTWKDPLLKTTKQLIWMVLPQGFRDSLLYFSQALEADLAYRELFPNTLLQYIDGLLLYRPSLETFYAHTTLLLNYLASLGYQVSKDKAQLSHQGLHI